MSDSQDQNDSKDSNNRTENDERASATKTEAPAESAAELPPPAPEQRVASLEAEKAELHDRMLRIAAEFDNWKKRSRKELTDGEARAKEQVLRDLLEVIDNLERATASWNEAKEIDPKAIRDGVDLVLRQFRSKLERYQVKPLEAKGVAFDPRFHEAISQVPAPDVKPGSVVHELQKGYMIGDRLLRPAMVVVAAAPPAPAPAEKPAEEAPSDKPKGQD
jgi:molecular chaperone GrpE